RNLLKLLHWEDGGFVVYYKRLEKGTFVPPAGGTASPLIRWPELVLMEEGMQVEKYRQKPRYLLPEKRLLYWHPVSFPGFPVTCGGMCVALCAAGALSLPPHRKIRFLRQLSTALCGKINHGKAAGRPYF